MKEIKKLVSGLKVLDKELKGCYVEMLFTDFEEYSITSIVESFHEYLEIWKKEDVESIELYEGFEKILNSLNLKELEKECKNKKAITNYIYMNI